MSGLYQNIQRLLRQTQLWILVGSLLTLAGVSWLSYHQNWRELTAQHNLYTQLAHTHIQNTLSRYTDIAGQVSSRTKARHLYKAYQDKTLSREKYLSGTIPIFSDGLRTNELMVGIQRLTPDLTPIAEAGDTHIPTPTVHPFPQQYFLSPPQIIRGSLHWAVLSPIKARDNAIIGYDWVTFRDELSSVFVSLKSANSQFTLSYNPSGARPQQFYLPANSTTLVATTPGTQHASGRPRQTSPFAQAGWALIAQQTTSPLRLILGQDQVNILAVFAFGLILFLLAKWALLRPLSNTILYSSQDLESEVKRKTIALEFTRSKALQERDEKSRFLASMSHELKTPLNAIQVMSEILLSRDKLTPDKQEKYQRTILHSSHVLRSTIESILAFSQIESSQYKPVWDHCTPTLLIEQCTDFIEVLAQQKNIEFIVHAPKDSPQTFNTDVKAIGHILTNLLSNAVKFTTKGSVTLRWHIAQHTLHIIIEDTGMGIPEDSLPHLFDRFTNAMDTSTLNQGGSGLGLSIVKGFVDILEGSIDVHSEVGKGTCFTLSIPEHD